MQRGLLFVVFCCFFTVAFMVGFDYLTDAKVLIKPFFLQPNLERMVCCDKSYFKK